MIEDKDIKNLLALSRIKVTPEEEKKLLTDVQGILGYIGEIQGIQVEGVEEEHSLINVMRPDENPHESGLYTEVILNEAPMREGDYVAVKKIL